MAQTSMVHPANSMKYTTCFNLHHKRKKYRTSWPLKEVTAESSPHMDLTSEDYGKQ